MALVNVDTLLQAAEEGGYAVGAFNCNNMEIVQAIIGAAEAEKSPVIIQASQGAIKYAGLNYIVALVRTAAEAASVPVALHLDHGTSFEQVIQCIGRGFTSVMIDWSKHPLEENIRVTNQILQVARPLDVSVEAELGKIGGTEDNVVVSEREASFTDPDEAAYFVKETGIRSLAVAIGTAHGQYKGEPKLDFDRLTTIKEKVGIPIVLHGSSGVPDAALKEAIARGVRKINIDTNLREAFTDGVREVLAEKPNEIDPRKILGPARDKMQARVVEKIRIFGSNGKA
ncbi:MAG: class II fructose-1,6-bisphosphate aldolase [Clostridiales bacterium]|nr:class II fructose-1,6-bisphosphate aldolase [Clostridiales bacterium]MDU7244721.1 class II fructose-1,6-bisphosphate aldolase [Clostridiales bacterium]